MTERSGSPAAPEAEADWGDINEPGTAPKRSVPLWVWGCGCGCLLVFLLVVLAGILFYRAVAESQDPEVQWQRLAEVVAYETRPEDFGISSLPFTTLIGVESFTLVPEEGEIAITFGQHPRDDARSTEDLFESGTEYFQFDFGREAAEGTLELQGREVRFLRGQSRGVQGFVAPPGDERVPSLALDLSRDGEVRFAFLQRVRGDDAIEDQEARELLEPFRLWEQK